MFCGGKKWSVKIEQNIVFNLLQLDELFLFHAPAENSRVDASPKRYTVIRGSKVLPDA